MPAFKSTEWEPICDAKYTTFKPTVRCAIEHTQHAAVLAAIESALCSTVLTAEYSAFQPSLRDSKYPTVEPAIGST